MPAPDERTPPARVAQSLGGTAVAGEIIHLAPVRTRSASVSTA